MLWRLVNVNEKDNWLSGLKIYQLGLFNQVHPP
jgi:hypothetical protein